MRDKNRLSTLMKLLESIWLSNQDIRFNQLLNLLHNRYCNDVDEACRVFDENTTDGARVGFDLFYVEDDPFIAFLKRIESKDLQL